MVADPVFDQPRLAEIYDDLDPDRGDLDVYVSIARELGARSVLDIGCGTGTFGLRSRGEGLRGYGRRPGRSHARGRPQEGGSRSGPVDTRW